MKSLVINFENEALVNQEDIFYEDELELQLLADTRDEPTVPLKYFIDTSPNQQAINNDRKSP